MGDNLHEDTKKKNPKQNHIITNHAMTSPKLNCIHPRKTN